MSVNYNYEQRIVAMRCIIDTAISLCVAPADERGECSVESLREAMEILAVNWGIPFLFTDDTKLSVEGLAYRKLQEIMSYVEQIDNDFDDKNKSLYEQREREHRIFGI